MTDGLKFNPLEVEQCAKEEFRRAAEILDKTKFDLEKFARFCSATGPICKPVQDQVHRFETEVQKAGERLAAEHQFCGESLLAFNRDMQCTDEGGAAIANAGGSRPANFNEYFLSRQGVGQPGVETS